MNDVWKGSNSDAPLPMSVAPNNLYFLNVIIIIIVSCVMHLLLLLQPRCYMYVRFAPRDAGDDSLHVSSVMTERLSETEKLS